MMQRIMVMGVSAGVGKSTFAQELGKILNINVHHLDALYWKPNWVESSLDEFLNGQEKVVKQDHWIIEGNYNRTSDIRLQHADTIIYLELPLFICLYRVFKRWISNIGETRPDMGENCKEKLDYQFLKYICTTYYPRRKKMNETFQNLAKNDSDIKVVLLKNKKEIHSYLFHLRN